VTGRKLNHLTIMFGFLHGVSYYTVKTRLTDFKMLQNATDKCKVYPVFN
jgi:hypothetical protein